MSGAHIQFSGGGGGFGRRRSSLNLSSFSSKKMKALFVTMVCLVVLFVTTIAVTLGNPVADSSKGHSEIVGGAQPEEKIFNGQDVADLKTLRLVQVLFRHGDRTPIDRYPNDPYNSRQYWPEGWGKLTERGKLMHYRLGQYIRHRYDGFLSSVYTADEIYVQSSDYDRTIMSAQANLAGMWPATPQEIQELPPGARQQFVPVHSISSDVDNKLAFTKTCPKYDKRLQEVSKQQSEVEFDLQYQTLYKELTQLTGLNVTTYFNVSDIYDDLFVQQAHNLTLPSWTKDFYPDKMLPLVEHWIQSYTREKDMRMLKTAPLLTDFVRNMKRLMGKPSDEEKKILEKLFHTPYVKFYMYSAHDTTLSAMLDGLGILETLPIKLPPYASSFYLELHQFPKEGKDGEYFVKVFYRTNLEKPAVEMELKNCKSKPCLFDDFMSMLTGYILDEKQWEHECKL